MEGSKSREDIVLELIATLNDTIPKPFDWLTVKRKYDGAERSPLTVVLLQELSRYNALLTLIQQSMADLVKGIRGLLLITPELESMFESLYHSAVPTAWHFYPSLKPLGSWARDLSLRVAQLRRWHDDEMPKVFWLGGLMHPKASLPLCCSILLARMASPSSASAGTTPSCPHKKRPWSAGREKAPTSRAVLGRCKVGCGEWLLGRAECYGAVQCTAARTFQACGRR